MGLRWRFGSCYGTTRCLPDSPMALLLTVQVRRRGRRLPWRLEWDTARPAVGRRAVAEGRGTTEGQGAQHEASIALGHGIRDGGVRIGISAGVNCLSVPCWHPSGALNTYGSGVLCCFVVSVTAAVWCVPFFGTVGFKSLRPLLARLSLYSFQTAKPSQRVCQPARAERGARVVHVSNSTHRP